MISKRRNIYLLTIMDFGLHTPINKVLYEMTYFERRYNTLTLMGSTSEKPYQGRGELGPPPSFSALETPKGQKLCSQISSVQTNLANAGQSGHPAMQDFKPKTYIQSLRCLLFHRPKVWLKVLSILFESILSYCGYGKNIQGRYEASSK